MPRSRVLAGAAVFATAAVVACGGGSIAEDPASSAHPASQASVAGHSAKHNKTQIKVLSNRADLLSGGDALVEIVLPAAQSTDFDALRVSLNGSDVTSAFAVRDGGRVSGLVTGLADGQNRLVARLPNGPAAVLTLTNYGRGGPIFSGPQIQPWACDTTSNPSLGEPVDAQCNAPTAYRYLYRSIGNQFLAYDPASPPPVANIATTTTDHGVTVPYIVRVERGTMNRGIHEIAVLFDPAQPWTAFARQPQWNRKVVMTYGAGTSQSYRQSTPESVLDNAALAAGYIVVGSSMMINRLHANFVSTAETTMMLKERIVEQYGEIRYTIGQGSSGGALLQHLVADNYPGLLDGLRPTSDWTDSISGAYREFADSAALTNAFDTSPLGYSAAERGAIGGFGEASAGVYARENERVGDYNMPDDGTNCAGAASYHPTTNPTGVRCTFQDFIANQIGARPDGKANLVFDNVGVQYGLVALLAGQVSVEKFVDVNVRAGGFDADGRRQAKRSSITPQVARLLHKTGQVTYGKYLGQVPELAIRGTNNNDYHYPFRTYVQRARLTAANGNADNHVFWIAPVGQSTLRTMDAWLAAIEADTQPGTKAEKIARNKPADLVNACWIAGQRVTDLGACDTTYPHFREPRTAAGDASTGYVMKCRLKPLSRGDYPGIEFSDAQWEALKTAFPDGVCDFSKPGVGFQPNEPWLCYADGPGGKAMGTAPESKPGAGGK